IAEILGVPPEVIDRIRIIEYADRIELQGNTIAVTRQDLIMLKFSGDSFFGDLETVLHEYFHVIYQWDNGMKFGDYLAASRSAAAQGLDPYYDNAYEVAARWFASRYKDQFNDLLMQSKGK